MKDKSKSAHEIHTFGRAFLDYSYYILVHVQPVFTLSIRCPEVEKKIFKEIWPLRVGGQGFRKYTIMCVLALQVLHTKCGQDWPNSFWEKLLMWYGIPCNIYKDEKIAKSDYNQGFKNFKIYNICPKNIWNSTKEIKGKTPASSIPIDSISYIDSISFTWLSYAESYYPLSKWNYE